MRTLEQIKARLLDPEIGEEEKRALRIGLGQNLSDQVAHLRVIYDLAISEAMRHRPNDSIMKEVTTLSWVIGSKMNYYNLPYFQFNLPRLRMIAREFLFPWPNNPRLWRMAEGSPCSEYCLHCANGSLSA